MRCVFAARAAQDIQEIGDYIARDNPRRAVTFVGELRARCEAIVLQPLAAPLKPEYGDGVRMVPFGRYLIFYAATEEVVLIERVLHGARDLEAQFDSE